MATYSTDLPHFDVVLFTLAYNKSIKYVAVSVQNLPILMIQNR
jgi:hypothetical protein